jgi:hypothetical protein
MAYIGYDAVGVGEMDLNYGVMTLLEDATQHGLNVTCANLAAKGALANTVRADHAGAPQGRHGTVFPPYLVVERGGVRLGFLALLSPETKVPGSMSTQGGEVEAINYIIRNPRETADALIPEAAGACDVLVLLAHMDRRELDELLADFPEVSIAVTGHESRSGAIGTPERVGSAYVVKATSQGQNIGVLAVTAGEAGISAVNNRIHFLNDSYEDDPDMVDKLEEFEVENRKIQKVLFAKSQLRASGATGAGDHYLGVGTCQSCHAEEFEVYKDTRHARAYATLAEQFMHRDTNCVGCHVTGWEDKGGFTGVRFRGAQVDLVDVQCEACHGPGALHNRDGSYLEKAAGSCEHCHTEKDDPDFDFETDWPKVAH